MVKYSTCQNLTIAAVGGEALLKDVKLISQVVHHIAECHKVRTKFEAPHTREVRAPILHSATQRVFQFVARYWIKSERINGASVVPGREPGLSCGDISKAYIGSLMYLPLTTVLTVISSLGLRMQP